MSFNLYQRQDGQFVMQYKRDPSFRGRRSWSEKRVPRRFDTKEKAIAWCKEYLAERKVEELRPVAGLDDVLSPMGEWPRDEAVYFLVCRNRVKIGHSTDPEDRLRHLRGILPFGFHLLAAAPGKRDLEKDFHRKFASLRQHGEWFSLDPRIIREMSMVRFGHPWARIGTMSARLE